jgi:hypothetical protein
MTTSKTDHRDSLYNPVLLDHLINLVTPSAARWNRMTCFAREKEAREIAARFEGNPVHLKLTDGRHIGPFCGELLVQALKNNPGAQPDSKTSRGEWLSELRSRAHAEWQSEISDDKEKQQ